MTPIWYDSTETGAPTLNNAAGSAIEVLRACLVNGFNLRSVTSIVVASGVATATAATHGYSAAFGKILRIEGAPEAGLNGDVQPLSVDTNTFTYACPGVADGTYTGTITARRTPLDWVEAHTGTNKAIFSRSSPEATASMLRVDDTRSVTTLAAVVSMVESATSVDSFTGQFPTSGWPYWLTGAATATAKNWVVVGDEKRIYFMCEKSTGGVPMVGFFGDPELLYPGDSGGCLLISHGSSSTNGPGGLTGAPTTTFAPATTSSNTMLFHRALPDASLGVAATLCGNASFGDIGMTDFNAVVPLIGDIHIKTPTEVRAKMPGLWLPQAVRPFTDRAILDAPVSGKKLLTITVMVSTSGQGQMMLDMTGPWG